jgi:hypothetical protein
LTILDQTSRATNPNKGGQNVYAALQKHDIDFELRNCEAKPSQIVSKNLADESEMGFLNANLDNETEEEELNERLVFNRK